MRLGDEQVVQAEDLRAQARADGDLRWKPLHRVHGVFRRGASSLRGQIALECAKRYY